MEQMMEDLVPTTEKMDAKIHTNNEKSEILQGTHRETRPRGVYSFVMSLYYSTP
jgi:hypothetical protein